MPNNIDALRTVADLIAAMQYLRECQHTRLAGYSTQFLLDIRREVKDFYDELGQLINRQMTHQTGDPRPFIEDVRRLK